MYVVFALIQPILIISVSLLHKLIAALSEDFLDITLIPPNKSLSVHFFNTLILVAVKKNGLNMVIFPFILSISVRSRFLRLSMEHI
jgi:hypothetical protein